jgi:hypothetical protein
MVIRVWPNQLIQSILDHTIFLIKFYFVLRSKGGDSGSPFHDVGLAIGIQASH